MIRIAICDDELIYRERLQELLIVYGKRKNVEMELLLYEDTKEYVANWKKEEEADILLLDVEMQYDRREEDGQWEDGIALKEFLSRHGSKTAILFATSHDEAMPEAFGTNVQGFLVKPIDAERLYTYLDKIIRENVYTQQKVFLDTGKTEVVELADIYWIKADGRYSIVKCGQEELFSDKKLGMWEEELERSGFYCVHRSYLVSFRKIRHIEDEIILENEDIVPLARKRKQEVKEEFARYLAREM